MTSSQTEEDHWELNKGKNDINIMYPHVMYLSMYLTYMYMYLPIA